MKICKKTGALSCQAFWMLLAAGIWAISSESFSEESNLTLERILAWPSREVPAWKAYLERSQSRMASDKEFFEKEMATKGVKTSFLPPKGRAFGPGYPNSDKWFSDPEASRIADIVVSFQTPSGGWCKGVDMTRHIRLPGERFCNDKNWRYVGTFDNNTTIAQMRFLARAFAATGNEAYKKAFLRGLEYVFVSQYPNGGWPQVYPLMAGYHDNITFNDGAMTNVMDLLREIAAGKAGFEFASPEERRRARVAFDRGIGCILDCQVIAGGKQTVWGQQHDPLTLKPAKARAYEMVSLSSAESARVMVELMEVEFASPRVKEAVETAAAWFKQTAIHGHAWRKDSDGDMKLLPAEGAEPIWARYYEIGTNRPLFSDKDAIVRYDVKEITPERRRAYGWYSINGRDALKKYQEWTKRHSGTKTTL
jgi:PelA/Pel-15E family pectate lyase